MSTLYPIRLQASLHETIWGGHRLADDKWKEIPSRNVLIGEAWETETNNVIQNGHYKGWTLADVTAELETDLLGEQAIKIYGKRFPLLAKFIDAHANLSVQVHPKDHYANTHEDGKLGKTEFWYVLSADPGAKIVHGFKYDTDVETVRRAIEETRLEEIIHEEPIQTGDVVFVPAGSVHAICEGILLYELQEYSDVTYRMYDYGRLGTNGKPRELHIERSLEVARFAATEKVKKQPITVADTNDYTDRCLIVCPYFATHEIALKDGQFQEQTSTSCIVLTSLDATASVCYGPDHSLYEPIQRGQTIVLPAALGAFALKGSGKLLYSYVPVPGNPVWKAWDAANVTAIDQ